LYDKEYPDYVLESTPHMYVKGRKGKFFNYKLFRYWVFNAVFYSVATILAVIYSIATPYDENGVVMNRTMTGTELLLLVILLFYL
jgi:magnesium-transporting ATPase (P-type)